MSGPSNNKRSILKAIAICISTLALVSIGALFCLPMLLTTSFGKEWLLSEVGERSGYKLQIDNLDLSWFGSQRAQGIKGENAKEQIFITCAEALTDASLWDLLIKRDLGHLKLLVPDLEVSGIRLGAVFRAPKPYIPNPVIAGFSPGSTTEFTGFEKGHIVIENGKIALKPAGFEPIHFEQIAMSLDMLSKEDAALQLSCATSQKQLLGEIALKASVSSLSSAFPNLAILASVKQLPVLGIDQLVSVFSPNLNGLIYEALGQTVDMQCQINAAKGNFDVSMNARSPQLSASVATKTENGVISLKSPATLKLNLTPALFQKIGKLSPSLGNLALSQTAILEGNLSQFSCKVPTSANDLLSSSFQATLSAPSPWNFSLNGAPLSFSNLKLLASSLSIEKELEIDLTSVIEIQMQKGSLAIGGRITQPFSKAPGGSLSVNATQFPTGLIGPSTLPAILGPTANLKGSFTLDANPKLHLSWQSQFLDIPSLDVDLNNLVKLTYPAKFTLRLNPQMAINSELKLVKADPIEGTLQNLSFPREDMKQLSLDVVMYAGQIAFAGSYPLNISQLKASLSVKTLSQILLEITSDPLKATLSGAYLPKTSEFVLNKQLEVQYTLDNNLLKSLSPNAPALAKPAPIRLTVDSFTYPISNAELFKLSLKGTLSCPSMTLGAEPKTITLQNTNLPFEWDAKGKTAQVQLSSEVQNSLPKPGSMQGQFRLTNFATKEGIDFNKAEILGTLDLQNLSSSLLDALSGHPSLSTITGGSFSGKLKLQSTPLKQNIAIKWVSPNINIDSAFEIVSTGINLQGTSNQATWILTPESYKVLDRFITGPNNAAVPFEILEPSIFTISLNALSIPTIPKQETTSLGSRIPDILFDLNKIKLGLAGHNPKLSFLDKSSKETIQLSNFVFGLDTNGSGTPLTASLDGDVVTLKSSTSSQEAAKKGVLSLKAKITPPSENKGQFDLSQLGCNLQMTAQQFPSRALDIIARAKGRTDLPFTTIFGEMINAKVATDIKNLSGPLSIHIDAPRTHLEVDGNLANGALTLLKPLYAQTKITPEMSKLFLKEVNPLNLSYIYSEDPITLEIPSNGFYFPLYPRDLSKMTIPSATIELGKIACRNEGNVNITLGLLKSQEFNKNGELLLWFAPIDLSIKQGVTSIERTEVLLANTYDICLWGNIDLVKEYVDMILGLTSQTLSKAFGVKKLPENYVLTLPMKGPLNNVQINTSKATAKIALLLAWQHANDAGAFGNSTAGAILGGLMETVAKLPDSDAKVPPAKHPFPWEVGKPPKKPKKTSQEKKRQFKSNEKPFKQILKVIR